MKKAIFLFLILQFAVQSINGQTIFAIQNGRWDDADTWNLGSGKIPTATDEVEINGYTVTIEDDTEMVKIKSLILENDIPGTETHLILQGKSNLNVSQYIRATASDLDNPVILELKENANAEVQGQVEFIRSEGNFSTGKLQLHLSGNSSLLVKGNFTYSYMSANQEEGTEILLTNKANLTVEGFATCNFSDGAEYGLISTDSSSIILKNDLTINKSGGGAMIFNIGHVLSIGGSLAINSFGGTNELSFKANGPVSNIKVSGDVNLVSTSGNSLRMVAKDAGVFDLRSNLNFTSTSDNDIAIHLEKNTQLFLGGNVNRPNNYGALKMAKGSSFILNGTSPQQLPQRVLEGSGEDRFNYEDIVLDNTAGYILTDTFFITGNMELSKGVLVSESYKPIVLADSAEITGGNKSAYINGPVIKRGRSSDAFVFPIGNAEKYAPITVGKITNQEAVLLAEYKGDPPPFGVFKTGITVVSNIEYWVLEQEEERVNLPITLHWEDAEASCISDLSTLIVVGQNEENEWQSFGRNVVTGGTGTGVSGSIQSLDGDPPPFGVFMFTIGSSDMQNSLPVELAKFDAIKQDSKVQLLWETASEMNTSHFTIQRSYDGINYESIGTQMAVGDSQDLQKYAFKDESPVYGDNYYRLEIEDYDGSIEYSPIEVITFELVPFLSIVPNPVANELRLEGPDVTFDGGTMEIYDQNGRLIFKGPFSFENGLFQMETSSLNVNMPGTYFLKINGTKETKALKFLKLN